MKYSFKIGSVSGIPIEVHITFILLMVIELVLSFPELYFFLFSLLLFVFVVAHELSHSFVAKHYNIQVRKIVLYPIGGVSEIEEIPENPRIEWRMAVAGPLASFALGAVLLLVSQWIVVETPSLPLILPTENLLLGLGELNVMLGAFNLVPAFPMDGGRVLRALLAERMKFSDATKYAAFIGRLLGVFMAVLGIFNFWLVIIGVFIYIGATEEAESTIVSTTLARVRVRDVMHPATAFAEPETTVAEALEIMFRARYHDLMVESGDSFQGIVTWGEIMKVSSERRNDVHVRELPVKQLAVFSDESVLEAYKIMARERVNLLPVVERQSPAKVVGVLTNESIAYAYEKAKALR